MHKQQGLILKKCKHVTLDAQQARIQHRENPEMQGQCERPYEYLVLQGLNVPNQLIFQAAGLAVSQLHLRTILRTYRSRLKT